MSKASKIINIGPQTMIWLHQVGVYGLDDIERIGAIEVYRRLKSAYPDKVTLNALWGLQGALLGIPYNKLPKSMKEDLLAELNAADEN